MSRSAFARSRRPSNPNLPIYILLVGMVALIVVVLLILPGLSSGPGVVIPTPLPRPASIDNTLGDPSAPVRVEEFADFQCPFCRRFVEEIEPRLILEYVEPGVVFFVYRQFPVLGAPSVRAAEASLCARDQGAFWAYHDVLYLNQDETNPQAFSDSRLLEFANGISLDSGAFSTCVDQRRFAGEVQADAQAALSAGLNATPSFIINGRSLVGLVSYGEFAQLLEEALP
ncbi:MAG: DsbA family protein [Anaerolineales bacterium]